MIGENDCGYEQVLIILKTILIVTEGDHND